MIKNLHSRLFVFAALAVLLLGQCKSLQKSYPTRPVRSGLHPTSDLPEVQALAYHLNDSLTKVYLSIGNDNLLYKRTDTATAFYARLRIYAEIRPKNASRKISDSLSFYLYDGSVSEKVNAGNLQTSFTCRLNAGEYIMDIICTDENRHVRYKKSLSVSKTNHFSAQNFMMIASDSIHFGNQLLLGSEVLIRYAYPSASGIEVTCLRREIGPALPPFSTREKKEELLNPDTTYIVPLTEGQAVLQLRDKGVYQFRIPTAVSFGADREGLYAFTVEPSFPGVSNSREMIQCTRYLMSKDEYEKCLNAEDEKIAIEKFWLDIAGSQERARELLRKYYNRVKEANRNYSSYLPGWKTDRGMIYIVMGQPYSTFSGTDSETWVYGTEANPNSLRFIFTKKSSALTDMDYTLDRSVFYKDPFHVAVEYWRQGLIFNDSGR